VAPAGAGAALVSVDAAGASLEAADGDVVVPPHAHIVAAMTANAIARFTIGTLH
jgi:hypothetical protein